MVKNSKEIKARVTSEQHKLIKALAKAERTTITNLIKNSLLNYDEFYLHKKVISIDGSLKNLEKDYIILFKEILNKLQNPSKDISKTINKVERRLNK